MLSSRIVTSALLIATAAVLSVGLTGCDDLDSHGDFELGFDGDNLLVVSCHDATVSEVQVSEYVRESGNSSSEPIWIASGSTEVLAGEPLIVGGENPGLINELVVAPAPRAGIQYYFIFSDMPNRIPTAQFFWPEDGVAPGQWLTTRGDLHDEPCKVGGE